MVVPARPFLRRLIDLLCGVSNPSHFINLTKEVKADLETWILFLCSYNGITYFRSAVVSSVDINLISDASSQGFGGCYLSHWVQHPFPLEWSPLHITVLELYPVYVLISMFGRYFKNKSVRFFCDNQAVCFIINKQSSRNKHVMAIMRKLILVLIHYNIQLVARHIPGIDNILSDKISRFQATPDLLTYYHMDPEKTTIPSQLHPSSFSFR